MAQLKEDEYAKLTEIVIHRTGYRVSGIDPKYLRESKEEMEAIEQIKEEIERESGKKMTMMTKFKICLGLSVMTYGFINGVEYTIKRNSVEKRLSNAELKQIAKDAMEQLGIGSLVFFC